MHLIGLYSASNPSLNLTTGPVLSQNHTVRYLVANTIPHFKELNNVILELYTSRK